MKKIYLAIDGDNIGQHLEYLMLVNDQKALIEFSSSFQSAMDWLKDKLINDLGAIIIFSGGDNLLAILQTDNPPLRELETLRYEFMKQTRSTLSMGLGGNLQQAYFALKLAKTSGKNCIRQFKELVNG